MIQANSTYIEAALITAGTNLISAVLTGTVIWFWQQSRSRALLQTLESEKAELKLKVDAISSLHSNRIASFPPLITAAVSASSAARKIYATVGSDRDIVIAILVSQIPIVAASLDQIHAAQSNTTLNPDDMKRISNVRDALVAFIFALSFDEKADMVLVGAFEALMATSKSFEDYVREQVRTIPALQGIKPSIDPTTTLRYPKSMKVSAQYAQEHFADILTAIDTGEEVELTRTGQPSMPSSCWTPLPQSVLDSAYKILYK